MKRTLVVLLFLLAVGLPASAGESPAKTAVKKATARAFALLDAGKYEEALTAASPWGGRLGGEIRQRVRKDAASLEMHRAWFRLWPFGYVSRDTNARRVWEEMMSLLLERVPPASEDADEVIRQSHAARDSWRKLVAAGKAGDAGEVEELAALIIERFPRSLFVAPAVLSVSKRGRSMEVAEYEGWLERMRKAEVAERSLVVVLLARAQDNRSAACWLEVRERSTLAAERRRALLKAAEAHGRGKDPESLAAARKTYGEFLAEYPDAWEARTAREGSLQTHLVAGDAAAALAALRGFEREAAEGTDFSPEHFLVAKGFYAKKNLPMAVAILREVLIRFPKGAAAAEACIGLGEAYRDLGDDEKMVAAYRRALEYAAVDTATNVMDASNTRNRAHVALAEHAMKKDDWAAALHWWKEWKPTSLCGTCGEGMATRRLKEIATCQEKLGKADDALKTLEKRALESGWPSAAVEILWVDLMIRAGRREEMEKKVAAAHAKPRPSGKPRAIVVYVRMLRAADREDPAPVWEVMKDRPLPGPHDTDWRVEKGTEVLLSMPDVTKVFLRKRLATGEGREVLHAAWILSGLKDEGSLPAFVERLHDKTHSRTTRSLLNALLSMETDVATGLVRALANGPDARLAREAKREMERRGLE